MANEEQLALLKQGVEGWNQWREKNPSARVDLSEANLSNADLSGANLTKANLIRANLFEVDLIRANLFEADISYSNLGDAELIDANLSSADLSGVSLRYADLSGSNFCNANLSGANLNAAQVLHTNFEGAAFTGACIEDWQIGSSTKLHGAGCKYIFRTYDIEKREFAGRLPVDPNSIFATGEFEQWMQVRKSALDTIDITFKDGIDWQLFFQSLQVARQQHPEVNVVMQAVEERGGTFVARLRVETEVTGKTLEQLKADIETGIKNIYDRQLEGARGEIRSLERSLDNALGKLAMTSKNTSYNTFHGPVGNVANMNYGQMTAYINQNGAEIRQLIGSLRTTVQTFPAVQKEEVLMDLDELEESLSKPEKQDRQRIGIRLKRLIAAGTAAASISGGVATFSGDINEFTKNVMELGEQLGLTRELLQGDVDSSE